MKMVFANLSASVIIPTYNNSKTLATAIKFFSLQTRKDFELIIADDGSADSTKEFVQEQMKSDPRLRYFFQEDLGFRPGQARNLGAANAKTGILIFLNDDMVPSLNLVEEHIKLQKKADIILGYSASYGSHEHYSLHQFEALLKERKSLSTLPIIKEFRESFFVDKLKNSSKNNKQLWRFFLASNFSIKKDKFEKFDEDFIGWGGEDIELGYRLCKKHTSILLSKECLAYNLSEEPGSISMFTKEKFQSFIKNLILFYRKHPTKEIIDFVAESYHAGPDEFKKDMPFEKWLSGL